MDRSVFILSCLLGLGIAFAIFLALGPKRRALISSPIWWAFMIVGAVLCMYGLSHSTTPSFAPRITVTGNATAFVEQRYGRDSKFTFSFSPDGRSPVQLDTHIIVPHWGNSEIFGGRTLRITYLDDSYRTAKNEAIDIAILGGENAGWEDSLDARPLGIWLEIPLGGLIAGFGYLGIRYRKDDLAKAGPSDIASPSV